MTTACVFKYNNHNWAWSEKEITDKLENISKLDSNKVAWIRSDLDVSDSNWLTRIIWTLVAKFFEWMRIKLYGVDLEMSRAILVQIGKYLKNEDDLTHLFRNAVAKFNEIAPNHGIYEHAEDTIYAMVEQDYSNYFIFKAMTGSGLNEKQLLILIQRAKEKFAERKKNSPPEIEDEEIVDSMELEEIPKITLPSTMPVKNTLIQGSATQFDPKFKDKGKSACTCICLKACEKLLDAIVTESITSGNIDQILNEGVELWEKNSVSMEHLDVSEINFSGLNLKIPETHNIYGGSTKPSFSYSFTDVMVHAIGEHDYPFTMVFTKPPESIAVLVNSPEEYWLFDSHGDPSRGRKAFLESFSSFDGLIKAIHLRFPYFKPEESVYDDAALKELLDMQYNVFTAQVLVRK